ncbi:cysteine desulfurase [bacterium]|jgi:cysteine desulfurase|nr:cysteine desulfurase [bacterium]
MIYLDAHSTTPLDPRVFEAMKPYFLEHFGNASHGLNRFNWEAQAGVTLAREQLARALGAHPREILFTGGATEANHLAILGLEAMLRSSGRKKILSIRIEHASVLGAIELLCERGFEVEWIRIHADGRVDFDHLEECFARFGHEVGLVSVALANHEVGTIQDLRAIADRAHAFGAFVHTDAVQAFGKIPFTVDALGVDLLTLSAHKIHGPKGAGALYFRRKNPRVLLEPIQLGGGQEGGYRPGTPNTPAIVGFGAAAEIAMTVIESEGRRVAELRDLLFAGLRSGLDCIVRNGSTLHALPNNLNVSVEGVDGAALFSRLKGVAVSNASACLNGVQDHSQVLPELGVSKSLARATLRFGIGRFNTEAEIREAVAEVVAVVSELRRFEKEFARASGAVFLKEEMPNGGCKS